MGGRTAQFLVGTCALEEDVELEFAIKHLLNCVQVAIRQCLVGELQDPGRIGVAGGGAFERLERSSSVLHNVSHDILCTFM